METFAYYITLVSGFFVIFLLWNLTNASIFKNVTNWVQICHVCS